MNVAVCGGTGFLGRALVRALLARGHRVLVLARNPERAEPLFPPEVTCARFDAFGSLDPKILRGHHALFQLAGEPIFQRWTAEAKRKIRDSRELAAQTLSRAAVEAGVQAFFVGSAIGYYGNSEWKTFTEDSPPGSGFPALVCRRHEEAASETKEHYRLVALRTGLVLHPEGGVLKQMLPVFHRGLGGRLGSGEQWMSWIHLEDAVGLMLLSLEGSIVGPLNVVAPTPVTNSEFTRALGSVLHRPTLLPVPEIALRLGLGEAASLALEGQRVLPNRALKSGYAFRFPTLELALKDLFRPESSARNG